MKPAGVPNDIYRALKRWCATQRAILTNRDQVRRRRVIYPAAGGP